MNLRDTLATSPLWAQPPLAVVANLVVFIALVVVAGAIIVDFVHYHRQRGRDVVNSDRSLVETGSMTTFFIVYYLVIRFRVLEVGTYGGVRATMIVVGLDLVVAGVALNVWGRVALESNWANQIKIYEGHTLKTRGPYSIVRHPLYASLIWVFVGGSLVYSNALSLVLTLGVFVPMMILRAKKEEALLSDAFGVEHEAYRKRTGMLLPRARRR
jgi:protein-S-isoprenylcysteine O-methyltransferase Ste14